MRRLALVVGLLLSSACAKPEPAPTLAKPVRAELFERARAEVKAPEKRRHDATVYLDGSPLGVLRYRELPWKLQPQWPEVGDGRRVRRYRLADYLEVLGVDLAKAGEIHIYGGRNRISIVTGEDLLRGREHLLFSFTQGERGKPRMHYPSGGIVPVNTQIDIIQDIAVYAARPAPKYEPIKHYVAFEDGRPIVGIPYASNEGPGGTRVYVDGKLATTIKRKTLLDRVAVPGTAETGTTRYSWAALLKELQIEPGSVRGVDLVARDEIVGHLGGAEIASGPASTFVLPRRSRGLLQMDAFDHKIESVSFMVRAEPGSAIAQRSVAEGRGKQPSAAARTVQSPAVVTAKSL